MASLCGIFITIVTLFANLCWAAHTNTTLQNVMSYGAVGDGSHDDTPALKKAWEAACKSWSNATIVVPSGKKFLLNPIKFSGPCNSPVSLHIEGVIIAPAHPSAWNKADRSKWLEFSGITGLTVDGGGIINGQGQVWWQNSCKLNKKYPCRKAPTAMYIGRCKNAVVANLQFVNSQQIHIGIFYSSNVQLSGIKMEAPKDSPNTDGIHLQGVTNITIHDCDIATGDDCISITSGTSNIDIQNIRCGPGHGISIGSLGKRGERASVEKINVKNVVFDGSENGARIKTWQGGSGYARQIMFSDITVNNVYNPIIIDQYYCDSSKPCKIQKSAVQIEEVEYSNIKGTSLQENAVNFDCSKSVPCRGIVLRNIDIKSAVTSETKSVCVNAYGLASADVFPLSCLRN